MGKCLLGIMLCFTGRKEQYLTLSIHYEVLCILSREYTKKMEEEEKEGGRNENSATLTTQVHSYFLDTH